MSNGIAFAALLLLLFATAATAEFSMRLLPRDSVLVHPNNFTKHERLVRAIRNAKSYPHRYDKKSGVKPDTPRPPMVEQRMLYLVSVYIGTLDNGSPMLTKLHFDLGSDLTWIQCLPCDPCFQHPNQDFDPSKSSTFRSLPHDHRHCGGLNQDPNAPNNGLCNYKINYFDDTSVVGYLASERFAMRNEEDEDQEHFFDIYQGLTFGCTTSSSFPPNDVGDWDGILGMGHKPYSFVSQLKPIIKNKFSYCLVPPDNDHGSFLRFGNTPPGNYKTTPLTMFEESGKYYLELNDISVGKTRLNLPANTFEVKGPDVGGFVVDTGAAVSHLVDDAYKAVGFALIVILDGLNLSPADSWEDMDICYHTPENPQNVLPGMTLHFENADYDIPYDQAFLFNQETGVFCLAMHKSEDMSLFGAHQMINKRFSFDLDALVLSFAPADCEEI